MASSNSSSNTASKPADLRIGILGLDTSHVIAFTQALNKPASPEQHVPGGKVVAALKSWSPDVEASYSRVEGYTKQMTEEFGVKMYATAEEVAANVDAIMIENVDGRPHLELARKVFPFGKPVFIDKPLAGSLRDALEIARLGKQYNTPWFTSSSLRYGPNIPEIMSGKLGALRCVVAQSPAGLEPHHPDLFWYAIHAVEPLITVLGCGCQTVVRTHTAETDIVTGVWSDGRVGVVCGIRNAEPTFHIKAYGTKGTAESNGYIYGALLKEIIKFFQTKEVPVPQAQSLEIIAFMEAADESKRRGGVPVSLAEVIKANGG
ncbi:MAG: Gfo/Idh/MocA family oxidoreductase [Opitutae bacterium]|nr:Gfo/Idh/MocA family oxidoreductase [Opitutae bacterium]